MSYQHFIHHYNLNINILTYNSLVSSIPRGWKRLIKDYGKKLHDCLHDNLKFLKIYEKPSHVFIWKSSNKQEAQRATYRAPEYNVPSFWRIGQGGHLVLPIGPKNTDLVEDVEILLPVKFRWIPFSGFRGEVENVSANQRPGGPSCFSYRPEKHKLGRGHWDLVFCQVSLNSVQRFQRRSRKCLSQSEARAAILFFPIGPKNTNLAEDVEILLPVKFRWIPFSSFRGEVKNVSANQRPGRPSCFSYRPEKHKLGRGRWDLASCQVSLNSVQRFQRRSRKCLSQSEARVAILFFLSARKTQTW